jgi:hypothetical protein
VSDAAQPITGARNPLEFPVSRSFLRCRGLPRQVPVSGDKSFLQLSGRPAQEVCANNFKKISCPHAHPHLLRCYPPTRRILHRSIHSSVHSQPTVTESSGSLYRQSGATRPGEPNLCRPGRWTSSADPHSCPSARSEPAWKPRPCRGSPGSFRQVLSQTAPAPAAHQDRCAITSPIGEAMCHRPRGN